MPNHRQIVARGFRVGGWLLGAPSLAALLAVCASLVFVRAPADKSSYLDIGTYGIAGLIANGAKGVGDVLGWFGGIGVWIEEALAAGLAAALAFAIVLYLTGRGLARHSPAARIVGIGLSVVFLLFWTLVLLSLNRSAMAVPAVGMGVSIYAIWVLGWVSRISHTP